MAAMRAACTARSRSARVEWAEIERDWQRRTIDRWARMLDETDADAHCARMTGRRLLVLVWRDELWRVLVDSDASPEAMLGRNCNAATLWAAGDLALRRGATQFADAVTAALGGVDHLEAAARRAQRALQRSPPRPRD